VTVVGGDAAAARRFRWLAGVQFEPERITRMTRAMETHFQHNGRLDVSVEAHAKPAAGGVDVCVATTLGPKVTIASLTFPGRAAVAEHELVAVLSGKDDQLNRIGGTYDAETLVKDAGELRGVYFDHGYADVSIGTPRVVRRGARLAVELPIVEGAQYRLGKITTSDRIYGPIGLSRGDIPSRKIWDKVSALRDRLDAEDVEVEPTYQRDTHTIDLRLVIRWRWPWDALRSWRSSPR
jgi:outer membrane protein insertion porin family